MKRIKALFYTQGKFGKEWRRTADTDNPDLYSYGRYPTKIQAEDLPEYYLPISSRSIWYMQGYLKTSGIADIGYTYCKVNHLFKDDYIYISYKEKLRKTETEWGTVKYENYDLCISGNDIVDIVLAAEKYSSIDTSEVRSLIEEKRIWLRDNEPAEYEQAVGEDRDIFELWMQRGYIDGRLP